MNTINCFKKLKGCLQTQLFTADGERIVLFHDEPITEDEIKEISQLTMDDLKMVMKAVFKFKEYKVDALRLLDE